MLNPPEIKRLLEMHAKDLPYSFIAKELKVTRNVVVGYVGRLKQKGVIKTSKPKNKKPVPEKAVKKHKLFRHEMYAGLIMHMTAKMKKPDKVIPWEYEPLGVPVTIMGLTSKTCRWPCSGGLYCGADVHKRGYCTVHYKESRPKETK